VPINLTWFAGSLDAPAVNGSTFHWYVFAIPKRNRYRADHYVICDYLQVRDWVLDFDAPLGNDHRDHKNWRADLRIFVGQPSEEQGYFRWGDETTTANDRPGRVFALDNLATVVAPAPAGLHVGAFGPGGESEAHRLLKLYVAAQPVAFGLSSQASAHVEYPFATGDRVDVLFENHLPERTVVEVEVAGEQNVCVGVLQAIKYRTLAAVDAGYPLLTSKVRSLVVAYTTEYDRAALLAERYEIELQSVDRELVLATAQ
jgi:hypothetical protein